MIELVLRMRNEIMGCFCLLVITAKLIGFLLHAMV